MKHTLLFTDPGADTVAFAGGKGANLAVLTRAGFPVPRGFVVVAPAYAEFVAQAAWLRDAVAALPVDDPAALQAAAAALRERLLALPLPTAIEAELRARLAELGLVARAVSVRSSSTAEDTASAAFAGQHDTYLSVLGADAVVAHVRRCFASLWSDRAIAYRHRQRIDHLGATMAVVVQELVASEVSGVGFSIDPVGGDLEAMIVDANYGLGESVVSGEAAVDHWVLAKADLAVRSATIAEKTLGVVAAAVGTAEARIEGAARLAPCLPDDRLRAVGDLLRRVEAHYQFPQDIEWAYADGTLHLLQARPITTIPPRWTRDESAERFPNAITPLTWDFVAEGFHASLNFSLRLMGYPPFTGQWFALHGHYVYGNQNAVAIYARRDPLGVRSLEELRAAKPRLREAFRWVQELPLVWARDLDHYLVRIGELQATPLEDRSLAEVWAFVRAVNELGAGYFLPNIAISLAQGGLHKVLHALLLLMVGPGDTPRLYDDLLAFCETKTGQINRELYEIARLVRARPALERALQERGAREAWEAGVLAAYPEVERRFRKFLTDHGHREIDFDAYAPTWLEAPWVVLDNLRLLLQMPLERSGHEKERELRIRMQRAELELYERVPEDMRYFLAEVLRMARTYTSLDDLEHYQTTRLTLPLRRGLRELGARLVERGVLDEPMDVFFARRASLDAAIGDESPERWLALQAEIAAAKRSYLDARARAPEWVLGATAPPAGATAGALRGLPGSGGAAEGEVFQVLAAEDFGRFPRGAVLVARTTNPTWTPLFYSACAVVTESGGPLSHGAVTAREMRIPAVMGVRECLRQLPTGTRVRVDGTQGTVTVL